MRIVIADDLTELPEQWPEQWMEAFSRAPAAGSPQGKSGKRRTVINDAFVAACMLSPRDKAPEPAPPPAQSDCPPAEPLPACPPCDLRDQPELLSTILDALGVALLNRGCLPEGKRLIELALEIRRTFLGKRHPAVAASLNNVARVLRMEDNLLRAGKTIAEALAINKAAYGANGLPLVATYVEQSVLQLYQGDARAAERTAKRGLAILKRLGLERYDANTTRLLDALGRSLETRGRLASDKKAARIFFTAAVKTMATAVSMDEKQVGTNHPKYATHRANLACAQWALNKLDLAAEGFREAIRVYEQVLQRPGHPNLIDAYANWGSVLSQMGRYADAKDALCRALTHNQQSRGPMHTLVGNDHANLGRLYFRQKDYQRATDEFNAALKIYLANVKAGRLPARHPYIAEVREWLCKPQT